MYLRIILNSPVMSVRAHRQANAEISISMACKEWQNSRMACNQSPKLRWHCCLSNTTPLQNVSFVSSGLVLWGKSIHHQNLYQHNILQFKHLFVSAKMCTVLCAHKVKLFERKIKIFFWNYMIRHHSTTIKASCKCYLLSVWLKLLR